MATKTKNAEFAERFVELSKQGLAVSTMKELSEIVMKMSSGQDFELSLQEEAALRLKPTKAFKKACALMANEEAVSGLLALFTRAPENANRSYLWLGLLLRLSSIPTFAEKFGATSAAGVLFDFQSAHLSNALASFRARAEGAQSCVGWCESVIMYLKVVTRLVQSSRQFASEALHLRLFHKLLDAFPVAQQPFFSWAGENELTGVSVLTIKMGTLLKDLCEDRTPEFPFLASDAELVGRWVDSYLNFAGILKKRLSVYMSREEAKDIVDDAVAPLLRFAQYILLPHKSPKPAPQLTRAFSTPARLRLLLTWSDDLAAGDRWQDFGKQAVRAFSSLTQADEITPSYLGTNLGPPSESRAVTLLEEVRRASAQSVLARALTELEAEVQKLRWSPEQAAELAAGGSFGQLAQRARAFVRQLAARDCFALLMGILEKEKLSLRKASQGPVRPAILILHGLTSPFLDADEHGNRAYVAEIAEIGPRLLKFTREAMDLLATGLVASLVDILFGCFEMAPDRKWAARLELTDLLLAVSEKSGPCTAPSFSAWEFLKDLLPFLAEPTQEVRRMMTRLQSDGQERLNAWDGILGEMNGAIRRGDLRWGAEMSSRKFTSAVLDTLKAEADRNVSDEKSSAVFASMALVHCIQCAPEAVLREEAFAKAGCLVTCLQKAYAGMAEPFFLSDDQQQRVKTEEHKFRIWLRYEAVVSNLGRCLKALLGIPSNGPLLEEIACNGGVKLAAEVLRTKAAAQKFVRPETMLPVASGDMLGGLAALHAAAEVLWEEFSTKYSLKMCTYQACKGEVYETQKNAFRKCGACGQARYCSKECQALHWKKEHKALCRAQK